MKIRVAEIWCWRCCAPDLFRKSERLKSSDCCIHKFMGVLIVSLFVKRQKNQCSRKDQAPEVRQRKFMSCFCHREVVHSSTKIEVMQQIILPGPDVISRCKWIRDWSISKPLLWEKIDCFEAEYPVVADVLHRIILATESKRNLGTALYSNLWELRRHSFGREKKRWPEVT